MRPPTRRSIVSLAAAISIAACSPVGPASPPPSENASAAATAAAIETAGPERTPIPGFEEWQVINQQGVRISVEDGALVMNLIGALLWFNAERGVLLYREVTGDFRASATVRTSKASDPAAAPGEDGTVQLAGLMARTAVPAENYVFIVTGSIGLSTGLETKTTTDSRSIYPRVGLPTGGDAELRVCRIAASFTMWWRHVDSTDDWTLMSTFERRDMPQTLQVGANIYTDNAPDIVARFENLKIEPLPVGGACSSKPPAA